MQVKKIFAMEFCKMEREIRCKTIFKEFTLEMEERHLQ